MRYKVDEVREDGTVVLEGLGTKHIIHTSRDRIEGGDQLGPGSIITADMVLAAPAAAQPATKPVPSAPTQKG